MIRDNGYKMEEDRPEAGGLAYLRVIAVDREGNRVMEEDREITVTIDGHGSLLAVGSGNPCTEDRIGENACHLYNGTAILIIKRISEGRIDVSVRAEGLEGSRLTMSAR